MLFDRLNRVSAHAELPGDLELSFITRPGRAAAAAEPDHRPKRKREIESLSRAAASGRHCPRPGGHFACARRRTSVHPMGRPGVDCTLGATGRFSGSGHEAKKSCQSAAWFFLRRVWIFDRFGIAEAG